MIARALIIAFAAAAAFAEPYTFEPPLPASTMGVSLRVVSTWGDSCFPSKAQVTRNGNQVDVLWSTPRDTGCLTVISRWEDLVPLGLFAPGTYEVTMRVDTPAHIMSLGMKKLIVADGAPAFRMTSPFASTRGGSYITLTPLSGCYSVPLPVIVDGTSVPASPVACSLVATLPAHEAGPVDVTISSDTVKSTLRYLDPSAAPDEAVFARILIPVIFNGPGAFGSQWITLGEIHNTSSSSVEWFSDVAKPCGACYSVLPPNASLPVVIFGDHPNGVLVFVQRGLAEDVRFGAIVKDTSRESFLWGTELPIARERDFRTAELTIPNVPIDPLYRATLRIYGLDQLPLAASVSILQFQTRKSLASRAVTLTAPCTSLPCNSNQPAYASLDLASLIPPGTFPAGTSGLVTVTISQGSPVPARLWGFVSVTNNTTQAVTTLRPQ